MRSVRQEARTAPLDEREVRLLRSRRPGLLFLLMLAVDGMMTGGAVISATVNPGFPTIWIAIALTVVALLLASLTLHAATEWRFLRTELKTGVKVYRNGRIGSLSAHDDGESPTIYRIGIVGDDPEASIGFSVPQALYEAVGEGQAVRIAYTPLSLVLLELKTDDCVYIAADAKYGKAQPKTSAPGASAAR